VHDVFLTDSARSRKHSVESDSVVTGKVCYRVRKEDSGAEKKTNLEVEDEGNGKKTVCIKTRKAFVVCDQALVDTNVLPSVHTSRPLSPAAVTVRNHSRSRSKTATCSCARSPARQNQSELVSRNRCTL
jgi:hypothetical protein